MITKYANKIKGQFYGHTHSDIITINTDQRSKEITNFAFVCPSLSPLYIGKSRARVYKISTGKGEDNGVLDYSQYQFKELDSDIANWQL